jgi:hypothetical protein
VTRIAAPWLGVLWLSSLPLRLLQAQFAARVLELGPEAREHGDALGALALSTLLALLPCLLGRAFFVRAAWLGLRSERAPGKEALRVPIGSLLGYAYAALLFEALFFATAPTVVAIPLCVTGAGLAAANVSLSEPAGLVRPLRALAAAFGQGRVLFGLAFVFGVAFVVAMVNLHFLFQLGLWLAGGIPGLDLTAWATLLSFGNARFVLALLAGSSLLVEPFWLAALTVYVYRLRARETGEDLRLWFARLAREAV